MVSTDHRTKLTLRSIELGFLHCKALTKYKEINY